MSVDGRSEDEQPLLSTTSHEKKSKHLNLFTKNQLEKCNKNYVELLTELFFLQHGGNYVDFIQFKKRPSQQLKSYLEQNSIFGHLNIKQSVAETPIELPTKDIKKVSNEEDVSSFKASLVETVPLVR